MGPKTAGFQLLLAVALGLAACGTTRSPEDPPGTEPEAGSPGPAGVAYLEIDEFARRLGLTISDLSDNHATLRNDANSVMIFAPPARWLYVNGGRLGPLRDAVRLQGELVVSEAVLDEVRRRLLPILPHRPMPLPALASPPPAHPPPSKPKKPEPLEPVPQDLRGRTVVLDPGHGGKDSGAISVLGFFEKTVNLAVSRRIARLLGARGAKVVLIRTGDVFVELEERAARANREKPDLFVSIHSDSSEKQSVRGYTAYVARNASSASLAAAGAILEALRSTGLTSRGVVRANFRVLVRTRCPAVLVELGFLSNRAEAALLRNAAFQEKLAAALADGIRKAVLEK